MPSISGEGDSETVTVHLENYDGTEIYYTIDGSPIGMDAQKYEGPFEVSLPCTIRAVSAWDLNGGRSEELKITYYEPPATVPEVSVEDGQVQITQNGEGQDLYFRPDDQKISQVVTDERGMVDLERETWFTYYADGYDLSASQEHRLYFSKEGNLFADVDPRSWYYADFDRAVSNGYVEATNDSYIYEPEDMVTRGMLAQFLYRFDHADIDLDDAPFKDVPKQHPYAEAVAWGYERGLFAGTGGEMFEPDLPVTRQETAKILASYLGPQENVAPLRYQDGVYIAKWAYDSVALVTSLGLMNGTGVYFEPHNLITRGEMAVILSRMDLVE